jgi:putative Ca2+/H+ antiporter (TMEM165/GDT1 family)
MRRVLAASFLSVAIWALFPDKVAEDDCSTPRAGAFATALVTFFLAEIGDKTQIATMGLHAVLLVSRRGRRGAGETAGERDGMGPGALTAR